MNFKIVLSLALFLVLLTVGCQFIGTGKSPTNSPVPESTGSYPAYSVPSQIGPYPFPTLDVSTYPIPVLPSVLYPDINDGDEVRWDQATGMILNGEVTEVMQTHDLQVYLALKDGRTLVTLEPVIDEVIKVIEKCGEPCEKVRIATE